MINNKKRILSLVSGIIIIVAILVFNPDLIKADQKKIKPYYTGSVAVYKGVTYIATADLGKFELYKFTNNLLKRSYSLLPPEGNKQFYDVALNEEKGRLFAYLVNGTYVYKYDLTDPNMPKYVSRAIDNTGDWFIGIDTFNNGQRVVTHGTKNIKIWNTEFVTVDSFAMFNNFHYNTTFSTKANYIFNIKNDILHIYSVVERNAKADYVIHANTIHNRKVYYDNRREAIYLADDKGLKKIGLNGKLQKEFKHISSLGYDVDGSQDKKHVYFSDGYGIVKVDKDTLKAIKWKYTYNVGGKQGWATGLKVINDGRGEKLVVFNGNSIIVLDENFKVLATIGATEEDYGPYEDLFIKADKNRGPAGAEVSLHGGGFMKYEDLKIDIAGEKYEHKADSEGRFSKYIKVPDLKAQKSYINVKGVSSGKSFQMNYTIE